MQNGGRIAMEIVAPDFVENLAFPFNFLGRNDT